MTRVALAAARVATPTVLHEPGWVVIDGATIVDVGSGAPPDGVTVVDLGDRTLTPGFVDVHVHGGDGAQVNGEIADEVTEAVGEMARFHAQHGTTALVATTVSDTRARLLQAVTGVARAVGTFPGGAHVLGTHLEGPWISPNRRGAHDDSYLRPPDPAELRDLLDASQGTLRMVTLAPELPGAEETIELLTSAGVIASVGHTDADLETTRRAIHRGARHVTHLFNAMPGIHHREPGPVVAALGDPGVSVEIVADGHHVHPDVLGLVGRLIPDRLVAVTDAGAATGLEPGSHHLGDREVDVHDGRVTLADDPSTLAGSVLTLDRAVGVLTRHAGLPLTTALTAATRSPARVVGAATKGELRAGADADLVVLGPDLAAAATMVEGRVVHDADGLFAEVVDA